MLPKISGTNPLSSGAHGLDLEGARGLSQGGERRGNNLTDAPDTKPPQSKPVGPHLDQLLQIQRQERRGAASPQQPARFRQSTGPLQTRNPDAPTTQPSVAGSSALAMNSSKSEILAAPASGIQASPLILAGAAETGRASTSSPQKVTQQEFANVSQQLELKMQNLSKSEKAREKAAIEERKKLTSLSKQERKKIDWNGQLAHQNEIINGAKTKAEKANQAAVMFGEYGRKGDKYVLTDGSNNPVGVMSLDVDHDSKAMKIETIATDPSTSGNGGRLIAHAVNESQKRGMQGVVTLVDVSANQQHGHDGGQNIYAHIGFKPVDGEPGKMILNPGESDSWKKHAETWGRARSIQRVPEPQST